ncbi:10101_t:CDS:2, partial [Funneliformis mosseae]
NKIYGSLIKRFILNVDEIDSVVSGRDPWKKSIDPIKIRREVVILDSHQELCFLDEIDPVVSGRDP